MAEQKSLNVVASFSILADWVSVLGGSHVQVVSLVGNDEDVHVYAATPKDMVALARAEVLVINGLGLEGWMQRLIKSSGFDGQILEASHGINDISLDGQAKGHDEHESVHHHEADHHEHETHQIDPHAWMSLVEAKVYLKNIHAMLVQQLPQFRAEFDERLEQYLAQMDELHANIKEKLDALAIEQKRILLPHNSIAYMARDYGLQVVSLSGANTETESSAKVIAGVVRDLKANHIRALFVENIVNTRLIEQIQDETGFQVFGILVTGALSDTLAPNYLAMMRHNLGQISEALVTQR